MYEETKIELNISQARKLSDYLNRADWHGRRGGLTEAVKYVDLAAEVLKGVRHPGDPTSPVARLLETCQTARLFTATALSENGATHVKDLLIELRSLSLQALEQVESALYTPRKETARGPVR